MIYTFYNWQKIIALLRPFRLKSEKFCEKIFVNPRVHLVVDCFCRHVSSVGRWFWAKKIHGLLDKFSLFVPWNHRLIAKKDLKLFNITPEGLNAKNTLKVPNSANK